MSLPTRLTVKYWMGIEASAERRSSGRTVQMKETFILPERLVSKVRRAAMVPV
jgi:hypothetical protein